MEVNKILARLWW